MSSPRGTSPSLPAAALTFGVVGLLLPPAALVGAALALAARRRGSTGRRTMTAALAVSGAATVLWSLYIVLIVAGPAGSAWQETVRETREDFSIGLTSGFAGIEDPDAEDAVDIDHVVVGECLVSGDISSLFEIGILTDCRSPGAHLVVAVERIDIPTGERGDERAQQARAEAFCEERLVTIMGLREATSLDAGVFLPIGSGPSWYRQVVCHVSDPGGGRLPPELVSAVGGGLNGP